MRQVWLVAHRDLQESFRSRGYWITMGVLLLAVAAGIVVPNLFGGSGTSTLAVVGEPPPGMEAELDALADAFEVDLEVERHDDRQAAERAVRDDDVDAALVFGGERPEILRRDDEAETLVALASQATASAQVRQQLADAGLDDEEAARALAVPPPREVTVDEEQTGRTGMAFLVTLALYLAIFSGGMGVATGVAVEKANHVADVLVTMVRPTQLLAGRVVGAGVGTLLLLVAAAVPLSVAVLAGGIDVPAASAGDILGAIGWFVLGYAVYAIGFAALGALVDRQEELGSAIGPLSALLVLSYFAAAQALSEPGSTLAVVTSFLPVSSAMVMPVRVATGDASALEVAAAVAILVATILVLTRVGGTVYRRALVRGGSRLKLREVLRG